MARERRPWDRQSGESEPAHAALRIYLEAGDSRSLDAVVRKWNDSGTKSRNNSRSLLGKWSAKHRWVERALEWDRNVQRQRDRTVEAKAREWETRRLEALDSAWTQSRGMRVVAQKLLLTLVEGKTASLVKPASVGELCDLIRAATELERVVLAAAPGGVEVPFIDIAVNDEDDDDHYRIAAALEAYNTAPKPGAKVSDP